MKKRFLSLTLPALSMTGILCAQGNWPTNMHLYKVVQRP